MGAREGSVSRIPRVIQVARKDVEAGRRGVEEMNKRQALRTRYYGLRGSESSLQARGSPRTVLSRSDHALRQDPHWL